MKIFPISVPFHGDDYRLFTGVVNQGIDARLEAFTESKFRQGDRLYLDFAESELSILLRRLCELDDKGNDEAGRWADDIVDCQYGHEII